MLKFDKGQTLNVAYDRLKEGTMVTTGNKLLDALDILRERVKTPDA